MPATKENPDKVFKGEHQANQKNFENEKTHCTQTGLQTPKIPIKYYINETILTNNSQ